MACGKNSLPARAPLVKTLEQAKSFPALRHFSEFTRRPLRGPASQPSAILKNIIPDEGGKSPADAPVDARAAHPSGRFCYRAAGNYSLVGAYTELASSTGETRCGSPGSLRVVRSGQLRVATWSGRSVGRELGRPALGGRPKLCAETADGGSPLHSSRLPFILESGHFCFAKTGHSCFGLTGVCLPLRLRAPGDRISRRTPPCRSDNRKDSLGNSTQRILGNDHGRR